MRALKDHLQDGSLQPAELERRYEYATQARSMAALENLFHDLGGFTDESREWRMELRRRGRLLHMLDRVFLVAAVGLFLLLTLVRDVSWAWFLLPALILVPLLPRSLVHVSRESEIIYQDYAYPPAGSGDTTR